MHPLTQPELIRKFSELATNGGSAKFEVYVEAIERWFELRIYSHERSFCSLVAIDCTRQKKIERGLKEESNFWSYILRKIPGIFFMTQLQGQFVLWNHSLLTLLGLTEEQAPQSNLLSFIAEPDKPLVARMLNETPQDGEAIAEIKLISPAGKMATYLLSCHRITFLGVDYLIIAGSDISAQQEAVEKISIAKTAAERASQAKTQFLATMSHEIRTPMNGIIGLSRLALNEPASPEIRGYLKGISTSSQSLMGILNDILDFSKLEAGKVTIESAPFHLDSLLGILRSMFEENAIAKHIGFFINVMGDVPRELIGDNLRLQQILANLMNNAIKFTKQGGVTLSILLLKQEGEIATLRFSVQDSGIGMSHETQAKLFQPFMQADSSTSREFGGTGLGLAISRHLLQLMGSDFNVRSQSGLGTTISFDLAITAVLVEGQAQTLRSRTRHEAGALEAELKKAGASLHGVRVLLVEDNHINQIVARKFLTMSGMEVTTANNGQEAIELVNTWPFDVVLIDIHMPVMDGLEATRQIKANPKHADIPIIALTADVVQEEKEACLAAGMVDFAMKPIVPEALLATMGKWVKFRQ